MSQSIPVRLKEPHQNILEYLKERLGEDMASQVLRRGLVHLFESVADQDGLSVKERHEIMYSKPVKEIA